MTPVATLVRFNQTNPFEFHANAINVKRMAAKDMQG